MNRKSFEHIRLKSSKLEPKQNFKHEDFVAGITPNLRGSDSIMFVREPWVINQYIGFPSQEECNAYYRRNLDAGQKNVAITFNLATRKGFDSDDEQMQVDVGKKGTAIDSVEDFKILFDQIPLDKISVSLDSSKAILPILAFFIVTAEEQGIASNQLSGTLQNDTLKEFEVRNNYISTPTPSMKIITDILKYTSKNMPKFNPISISGYHLQEIGATAEIELAYTLANGLEYIKKGIEAGIKIDVLASNMSFFLTIGMDHFTEIAKLRAARMLWAKIVKQFNPKNQKSLTLKIHCKTSDSSLTEKDPFNNVARTTIEAMSAAFGGTESLHTNAFDKVIALPTGFSERIAKNIQTYLQQETNITKTVDPWAGSYHIEKLTEDIAYKAWELFREIEDLGGMTKAIEKGIPKLRIEEAAAFERTKIVSGNEIIVGVHKYQLKKEDSSYILDVDYESVRKSQIERLNQLKASRNTTEVKKALINLTNATKSDGENLLDLAIKAARNRATLGEISDAIKCIED